MQSIIKQYIKRTKTQLLPQALRSRSLKQFISQPYLVLALTGILCSIPVSHSCMPNNQYSRMKGFTQGTSYQITYLNSRAETYTEEIKNLMKDIDSSLSLYNSTSLIHTFNQGDSLIHMDPHMKNVIPEAFKINKITGGRFDITVAPLVNAFGFGPGERTQIDSTLIDSLKQYVGMGKLAVSGNKLIKQNKHVKIDVNAIAQGYTVDTVAGLLESKGIHHYLVEIGGEVTVKGNNPEGRAWRIGIDKPIDSNNAPGRHIQTIIERHQGAIATSGNYRKFYVEDGVKYTHSINPQTGYPTRQRLLSVTITGKPCMTCDALATACMIAGLEESKKLIKEMKGYEGYLVYSDQEGNFKVYESKGF